MTQHKEELALLEEEIEENPPAAILDFLDADDEVRPQIEMMFKLAKSYAKRVSRGNWYRWRTQWTKDLQPHVETEIQNLEVGGRGVEVVLGRLTDTIPTSIMSPSSKSSERTSRTRWRTCGGCTRV